MTIELYNSIFDRIKTLIDSPGWFSKLRGIITLVISLGVLAGLLLTIIIAGICKLLLLGVIPAISININDRSIK